MLLSTQPAKFISLLYQDNTVRIHTHTEDKSLWIVGKDLCKVLHKTNPSYFTKYLDRTDYCKHKIKTSKGFQKVLWFRVKALSNLEDVLYLQEFLLWLDTNLTAYVSGSNNTNRIFKEPIVIEKEDLEHLLDLVKKLYQSLLP